MPTVAVDVETYIGMFERLIDIYQGFHKINGVDILIDEFENAPLPDWICRKCGHESSEYANGEPCPRCSNPVTK